MEDKSSDSKVYSKIVDGLIDEPAYLLVFGLALVIFAAGAVTVAQNPWLAALMIGGALALAGFSIYYVEKRTRPVLPVETVEELNDLSKLQERRVATIGIFEGLVDNEVTCDFVYSNTLVESYLGHDGKRIEWHFSERERRVTTILDTEGIGKLHSLLVLGGKTERLQVMTAQDFTPPNWANNLILIGSRNSNPKSEEALTNFDSPFKFTDDVKAIASTDSGRGPWPGPDQENMDYGLIVKFKVAKANDIERVYLIVAGIGPIGTLACCYFLYQRIIDIHKRFKASPFAYVISVNRDLGFTSAREEASQAIAVRPDQS